MKILNAMFATLLVTMAVYSAAPQTSTSKPWNPATYHGLIMGKSTRADVYKVLGKPKFVGREQDTGIPIMTYVVVDPMPGTLVVYIKKGILDGMRLDLNKRLTKHDIIRIFGSDYIIVHYDTDDCLDEGGTVPIYQSPNGPIKTMEYRDRGIAVSFADDDDLKIDAISFTFKEIGPTHSLCAGRGKKK